jgi:hypothetical protein
MQNLQSNFQERVTLQRVSRLSRGNIRIQKGFFRTEEDWNTKKKNFDTVFQRVKAMLLSRP